jgi:hypothetical protein
MIIFQAYFEKKIKLIFIFFFKITLVDPILFVDRNMKN